MTTENRREPDHPIDPMFIERWSPRAFTGETMPESDLLTILEAARWAPSASNTQPWRFVYALKGSAEFDDIVSVLMGFNQVWAPQASALIIAISQTHIVGPGQTEASFARWHSHDTGAATMALLLEAGKLGYYGHPMGGVEGDKAKAVLGIPADGYVVETAIAIGKRADASILPEKLQEREVPSPRKPLAEIAFAGRFKA